LLVLAQIVAWTIGIRQSSLAAPVDILAAGYEALSEGTIWKATFQTIAAAAGGLALGGGLGLIAGIILGLSRPLTRLMQVSVDSFRPIPSVALLPLALLIFGFGYTLEISVVSFACFWPMLITSQSAVGSVDRRLLEVSRVLRLGALSCVAKIVLPAALPRIFIGGRLAAGIALIVAVTAEIALNPMGLGYELMSAQQNLQPDLMFALLFWVGLVGWTLNRVLMIAQARLFGAAGGGRLD
jgi:NitT/TauT family transport system permease protein